jgi:hypothetical protein
MDPNQGDYFESLLLEQLFGPILVSAASHS